MRKLTLLTVAMLAMAVLVAPPTLAQSQMDRANGTWLVRQGLSFNDVELVPAEMSPIVELLHLDVNTEVREVSSLFNAAKCGKASTLAADVTMVVPFTASLGIGHWQYDVRSIKVSSYHMLYGCDGEVMGVAWAIREATVTYDEPVAANGNRVVVLRPPGDVPFPPPQMATAWEGTTTIKFFTITGEPLLVPLALQGTTLDGPGVSELAGPFRAERAFGEPSR